MILHYELGVFDAIRSADLSHEVLFPLKSIPPAQGAPYSESELSRINPTHHFWKPLIERGFPFIKAQLLNENPYQLNIEQWAEVLDAHDINHKLVGIVRAHLEFLARTRKTK